MEILIGLLIIAIGSFCQSSSYVPIKKVKEWSWESFWLIQGVFAWLVFPFLGSLLGVPQESSLFDLWGAPLLRENRHRAANRYATESSSDLERSAKEFYGRIRQNRRTCLRPQEKRNRTCKQDRQTKGAPGAMQLRFRDIRRDLTPPPNYVRQKRRRVLVCTESIL